MMSKINLDSISKQAVLLSPYVLFAFFVLVSKILLIYIFGNPTPFWDQWDVEAYHLYRPFVEGKLTLPDLFALHNEHRIFTTRLLALALFVINGNVWKPILQMAVNATLHVAALTFLIMLLTHRFSLAHRFVTSLFCALIFAIPFAWENTLAAFQSQIYFLLFFSFIFLWCMASYKDFSLLSCIGLFFGILCLFSFASGIITLLAGVLIILLRRYAHQDKGLAGYVLILLLLILAFVAFIHTPVISGHQALKPQSFSEFVSSFTSILAWPINGKIGVFLINLPLTIVCLTILIKKQYHDKNNLFLLGVAIWLAGQYLSIGFGRAQGATSSRYLDLFSIGLVLNLVSLVILARQSAFRVGAYVGLFIWIVAVLIGFATTLPAIVAQVTFKRTSSLEQEKNVKNYLCTGEFLHLINKPDQHIPYPLPDRLKGMLDNPTIFGFLPGNLNPKNLNKRMQGVVAPVCNAASANLPYQVKALQSYDVMKVATSSALLSNHWGGSDYYRSKPDGMDVVGSFVTSDQDTGVVTIRLKKGDALLFRSGPSTNGQSMLIHGKNARKDKTPYSTNLPVVLDWSVLEFTHADLPDEFEVTFVDLGSGWGEWSAIALRKP